MLITYHTYEKKIEHKFHVKNIETARKIWERSVRHCSHQRYVLDLWCLKHRTGDDCTLIFELPQYSLESLVRKDADFERYFHELLGVHEEIIALIRIDIKHPDEQNFCQSCKNCKQGYYHEELPLKPKHVECTHHLIPCKYKVFAEEGDPLNFDKCTCSTACEYQDFGVSRTYPNPELKEI